VGRACRAGNRAVDVLADPEYDFGDAPRIGDYRALLGVPLLCDGQVEGVFALARPEPAPFTARQIEMVRSFVDQAVALARKLLVALWRYVMDGVIPDGAKMKAA
jgi:GAF domain-containing protein